MTPGPLRKVWSDYTFFRIVLQSQQSVAQNSSQALSRGGHANKHHSHSCNRARSTGILRKWWSRYAFFRILSQSQRSKPENQRSQQLKPRKSAQSTVKQRKRAVKVLTRGRSCDCRVQPPQVIVDKLTSIPACSHRAVLACPDDGSGHLCCPVCCPHHSQYLADRLFVSEDQSSHQTQVSSLDA